MISNHYERANNTYTGDLICDDAKPTKYIFYLCANYLYGWAMCYSLPVGYFKWMIDLEL